VNVPAVARRRRVGVLAVQGAFGRHAAVLTALGHEARLVRDPGEFAELEGLVLPGGESTVQLELITRLGLERELRELARSGHPILATCAGLILLASRVDQPAQRSLGLLDVDVVRKAYGRQLDSFESVSDESFESVSDEALPDEARIDEALTDSAAAATAAASRLPLVFIRAPRITRVGPGAEVLARHRGEPVLVRERNVTAATFHPELTADARVHRAVFG